jgi:arylsulfatase A-like enzyme
MTGRYPARLAIGLEEPLSWRKEAGDRVGLPPEHPSLASLLKSSGYRTALIGKWHLGYLPAFGPLKSGFDEFFGTMSGGAGYFTHKEANGENDLYEADLSVEKTGYLTDLLTTRAVDYIARSKMSRQPFYLSLHYTAPHFPWDSPSDPAAGKILKLGYKEMLAGGSARIYAEMMKSLDDGVGRVLDALASHDLARNTLVIFTSDNGGERFSRNGPFSGKKFELLEGGIRVPALLRWTGKILPGQISAQVAVTMDWTATILAAAQTAPARSHPLDGDDLLPVCRRERSPHERTLFWRNSDQDAIRSENWKYLRVKSDEFLFDLTKDPKEETDLKTIHPVVFDRLKSKFAKWNAAMLPRKKGT